MLRRSIRALIFHYRPLSFDYLITVSGEGPSSMRCTCETCQALSAGVPGDFFRGSLVFGPPKDWSVSYKLKNILKGT